MIRSGQSTAVMEGVQHDSKIGSVCLPFLLLLLNVVMEVLGLFTQWWEGSSCRVTREDWEAGYHVSALSLCTTAVLLWVWNWGAATASCWHDRLLLWPFLAQWAGWFVFMTQSSVLYCSFGCHTWKFNRGSISSSYWWFYSILYH